MFLDFATFKCFTLLSKYFFFLKGGHVLFKDLSEHRFNFNFLVN